MTVDENSVLRRAALVLDAFDGSEPVLPLTDIDGSPAG